MFPKGPCWCFCSLRVGAVVFTAFLSTVAFIALCYFAKNLMWCMDCYVAQVYLRECEERLHHSVFLLSLEIANTLLRFCNDLGQGDQDITIHCVRKMQVEKRALAGTLNRTYVTLTQELDQKVFKKTIPFHAVGVFLNIFIVIFALGLIIAVIRYRSMGMLPWLTYAGLPATYNWLYMLACIAIITEASYQWRVGFAVAFAIVGLAVFVLICLMIFSVAMYYAYLSTLEVFREDENKMSLLITTI